MILLIAAVAIAATKPMPVTADERRAVREVCAMQRAAEHDAAKARAGFKACLAQIPLDGDLPPKPKTR